jgi:hypothetical protein
VTKSSITDVFDNKKMVWISGKNEWKSPSGIITQWKERKNISGGAI